MVNFSNYERYVSYLEQWNNLLQEMAEIARACSDINLRTYYRDRLSIQFQEFISGLNNLEREIEQEFNAALDNRMTIASVGRETLRGNRWDVGFDEDYQYNEDDISTDIDEDVIDLTVGDSYENPIIIEDGVATNTQNVIVFQEPMAELNEEDMEVVNNLLSISSPVVPVRLFEDDEEEKKDET
jgi:hypothetical protein